MTAARAEIHTYDSPTLVYAMNWSVSGPNRAAGAGCRQVRGGNCLRSSAGEPTLLLPLSLALLQVRPDKPFRLAVGSYIEDYNNRVDIIARERGRAGAGRTSSCSTPTRP